MKKSKIAGVVLSCAAAAALIILILSKTGIENIEDYIGHMNYLWMIGAIVLYTFDVLLRAKRWGDILKDNNIEITLMDSFLAYNLGNSLNIIVPAKIGDIARSYYLKRKQDLNYSETLPATFLDRFFDVVGVYIVILVCSIYVVARVKLPVWFYDLLVIGIACLVIAFIAVWYLLKRKEKIQAIKQDKIRKFVESLIEVLEGSIKNRAKFARMTMLSVFIWTVEGLVAFAVFLSLNIWINPIVAIFTSMTATLTKIVPITPGGIGIFEGTMVIILSLFGMGTGEAGMASTLNHLVMNLYTLVIGVYVILKSGISISQIRGEKVEKS
jgi:uncharacterized protein (TIRG00374 family)